MLKFDFRVICVDFNKNHDWIIENRTSTNTFLGVNVNSTALLQALLTGLAPFLLSEWETVGKPALQSVINGVGSPDEKLALNALLQAVDVIAQAEIPKI